MLNRLVFYHTLVKSAGELSSHQENIPNEFEPEKINLFCKSHAHTQANPTGTFGIQRIANRRAI